MKFLLILFFPVLVFAGGMKNDFLTLRQASLPSICENGEIRQNTRGDILRCDTNVWHLIGPNFNPGLIENSILAQSVGSSAWTVDLKTIAALDPSASDSIRVAFRNTSADSATYTTQVVTSSLGITAPSGATLGCESGTNCYVWVYLIHGSSAVDICLSGIEIDESALQNASAIGTGSDSSNTIYCVGGHTSRPVRMIARYVFLNAPNGTYSSIANTGTAISPRISAVRGVAKAWGKITISGGSPTLSLNYNILGVSDDGTGLFGISFKRPMQTSTYTVMCTARHAVGSTAQNVCNIDSNDQNTTDFDIKINNDAGSSNDPEAFEITVFGDQ